MGGFSGPGDKNRQRHSVADTAANRSAVAVCAVGRFLRGDFHAGGFGQFFDGLDEIQVVVVHDEAEGVAASAAAEAVIELLVGADAERRSLSLWNGQQAVWFLPAFFNCRRELTTSTMSVRFRRSSMKLWGISPAMAFSSSALKGSRNVRRPNGGHCLRRAKCAARPVSSAYSLSGSVSAENPLTLMPISIRLFECVALNPLRPIIGPG